jgi:hypothetical protein
MTDTTTHLNERLRRPSGIRSLTLSDTKLSYAPDGQATLNARMMLPEVTEEFWAQHAEYLDEGGFLMASVGGLLVERDGRALLIDAGVGPISVGPHHRLRHPPRRHALRPRPHRGRPGGLAPHRRLRRPDRAGLPAGSPGARCSYSTSTRPARDGRPPATTRRPFRNWSVMNLNLNTKTAVVTGPAGASDSPPSRP